MPRLLDVVMVPEAACAGVGVFAAAGVPDAACAGVTCVVIDAAGAGTGAGRGRYRMGSTVAVPEGDSAYACVRPPMRTPPNCSPGTARSTVPPGSCGILDGTKERKPGGPASPACHLMPCKAGTGGRRASCAAMRRVAMPGASAAIAGLPRPNCLTSSSPMRPPERNCDVSSPLAAVPNPPKPSCRENWDATLPGRNCCPSAAKAPGRAAVPAAAAVPFATGTMRAAAPAAACSAAGAAVRPKSRPKTGAANVRPPKARPAPPHPAASLTAGGNAEA